ncbi:uncharacterized protein LOC135331441 isoform X2 [Halichondria panicea]|uniref:uncharacterized protein LOC135331441 isoform X2 n=1 Tax=Halichondria panicea TaxID=6063 RepID=UPI00312BAAEB
MAPTVLILSLLLSILSIQLSVALTSVCNPRDGTYGTPIDIHRTCSVYRDDSFSCMNNTFIHQWSALECGDEYRDQCIDSCPGFVGMNLTYECSFEGARLYRYKNGEYQYLNGSSVNYGLLLPEHAGLYECRNSANAEVHAQNITVNEEIRIGSHCKGFPYIDTRYMCCSSSSWSASSIGSSYEFAVYANPANNVSVTIEQIKWLVDKDARNGVDIGLYTLQNKTNPTIWKAGFRYIPYRVTDWNPRIKVLVTASTTNYSHSVCVTINFQLQKAGLQIENTSLPLNTTVSAGQEAIFQCRYAYASTKDASHFLIKIDYSKPVVFGNTTTIETCSMYLSLSTPYNYTSDNCTMPPVKKAVIKINSISSVVEYTLRIPKVNADLSGSIVSCSVVTFFTNRLQWRTSAYLTVIESANITVTESSQVTVTDSVTEVSTSGSEFAAFVVIILPVIVVIVFLVRKYRQRRVLNQNRHSYRHTRLYESQSTLCDTESDGAVCVQEQDDTFERNVAI